VICPQTPSPPPVPPVTDKTPVSELIDKPVPTFIPPSVDAEAIGNT
jgi:hypothetical protein